MKVIRPVAMTDDILTSSSIPETDYAAWVSGTAYAQGAHVIRAHRRWESLINSNSGNDPSLDTAGAKWLDMGATNQWSMFDEAKGSLATATGSITIVLTPGRIDSMALLDVAAAQVTVTATRGGVEVYRKTQATAVGGRNIDNWYDWFFAPIGVRTAFLFDDLPSYRDCIITVVIAGASGTSPVACGTLLIGRMFDIGTTLSGVDISIADYSKKERDQFGVISFTQRSYSDSNTYSIAMQSARVDDVKAALASLRATPTIWIGADGFDALFTYGIFSSFRINLTLLTGMSTVSLDLEGLV